VTVAYFTSNEEQKHVIVTSLFLVWFFFLWKWSCLFLLK